jgi:pimeloyl-ACP methyl ester carboxylesterase
MIVFAHGYDVTPDTYAPLLDAWVRAGFVVVAPFFPDENASAVAAQPHANTEDDLANEPADLAYVTRSVLSASAAETSNCPAAIGLVEPTEIALAGHSDGAVAAGMLAYDHGVDPQGINFANLRSGIDFRAVIILSGAEETTQSYATEATRPDLLVVQSRLDQCNPFRDGVQLYDNIHQSNKWFLQLQTAHHLPPFDGVDKSAFSVASSTTLRFLQMSLEDVSPSPSLLALGNQRPAIARMYSGVNGPAPENAPKVKENCGPN